MSVAVKSLESRINAVIGEAYSRGWVHADGDRQLPTWPVGMAADPGATISSLVRESNARTTLEVGFALGLSTLWMLQGLLSNDPNPRHTVVDPYQATDWKNAGLRLVHDAGVGDLVHHISEDSATALPRMSAEGRRFDLVLIDGGHWFENIFVDLLFATRLAHPGGLIIVDDVWMPAVRSAVEYFTLNCGVVPIPREDLPGASRFAILRTPDNPPKKTWDHFAPFERNTRRRSRKSGINKMDGWHGPTPVPADERGFDCRPQDRGAPSAGR